MIHRPTRVNPDLDDRLIQPNEAKSSYNIRFTTGTDQDNYSGGSKINDLILVPYSQPTGFNRSVGVKMDWQNRVLIRADWNSNGFHRFIRISETSVDVIVEGSWLGFDINKDVSIDVVGGLLFWTNVPNMQPMMLNISEAIAGKYPSIYLEWIYTQIKAQPIFPLIVTPNYLYNDTTFSIESVITQNSLTGGGRIKTKTGYQYAYYNVFNNNEESRIGAISDINFATENIDIEIPPFLIQSFYSYINIVKQIVFVFREGNTGVWRLLKRVNNVLGFTGKISIPDIFDIPKIAITSDITNARFDSVPLLSSTNKIATSRIFHANYLIDYPKIESLSLSLTVERFNNSYNPPPIDFTGDQNIISTFPSANEYDIGLEAVDFWGRTISVINPQRVNIRLPLVLSKVVASDNNPITVNKSVFDDDLTYNRLAVKYTISGAIPDWVASLRITMTSSQKFISLMKTVATVYLWYTDKDGIDQLIFTSFYGKDAKGPTATIYNTNYTEVFYLKGCAIVLNGGEPFLVSSGKDYYAKIYVDYDGTSATESIVPDFYKIDKQVNNILYISDNVNYNLQPSSFSPGCIKAAVDNTSNQNIANKLQKIESYNPLFYQVELCTSKGGSDVIYYDTNVNYSQAEYRNQISINGNASGYLYGDSYICYVNKFYNGTSQSVKLYWPGIPGSYNQNVIASVFQIDRFPYLAYFISMSPSDNFIQNWDATRGQENTVNDSQRQAKLENWIIPSDPIILGSEINGLNRFNSIDAQPMPAENGAIVDLLITNSTQTDPGVMIAMSKLSHQSIYLNATQFTNTDGTGNISGSTNVLGTNRPLIGKFGIERIKNSIVTPDGIVYFYSPVVNDLIRYAENGLVRLGQTFSFANTLRQDFGTETDVFVNFDQITNEVILIAKDKSAYIFFDPRGGEKSFQGFRDYFKGTLTPELGANFGTSVYYFVEGEIWKTDNQSVNNSFFGTLKDPSLEIVSNVEPTSLKRWNSYNIFGPKPVITQLNSGGGEIPPVQSEIRQGWWIDRKNNYTAAIRMDENSVGGILNGKVMESRILITNFTFNPTDFDKLNYIEVKATRSPTQ